MNKSEKIDAFFASKCFAISGVSRDKIKFGRVVYQAFIEHGLTVFPINPNIDNLDGVKVYSSVNDLPMEVDAIVIVNNRNKSQAIIDQAIAKGIKNIWIQQKSDPVGFKPSSVDPVFNVITNECIFMWLEPVAGFHKFHWFLRNLFSVNKK